MLTPTLKSALFHSLRGNPFIMDIEIEDMIAEIEPHVIPNKTTWSEFELIAYRAFDIPWAYPHEEVLNIWLRMYHEPTADWGIIHIPATNPDVRGIKNRLNQIGIVRKRAA